MKKPEKRPTGEHLKDFCIEDDDFNHGYNQAIEEYEKYHEETLKEALAHQELELWTRHKKHWLGKLPSEDEIREIIEKEILAWNQEGFIPKLYIAKAIAKRIERRTE